MIKQSGTWWIGWIEEVAGVNCQERTREELLESLKVTLREALALTRREGARRLAKASRKRRLRYEARRTAAPPSSPWLYAASGVISRRRRSPMVRRAWWRSWPACRDSQNSALVPK